MSSLFRRRSLIFRLLLLSVAAVTLPALVLSAVYRSISSRALLESIEEQQTELARRIAEEVNDQVEQARSLLALSAHSAYFSAGSRVDQLGALRNLLHFSPSFQEAMLTDGSGMELLKVVQPGASPQLVKRSEDLRRPFVGPPFFSGTRTPTILLAEPVRAAGYPRRAGAILAKMSFTTLGALVRQATVGPHGLAYIVDSRGMLLAHPDDNLVLSHTHWGFKRVVRAWRVNPAVPTGLTRDKDEAGGELLSIAYPIPLLNSAVVIQQPQADVYAPLQHMRRQFILWTCLSVLLFLSLAVAVAWRILKPLRKLQAAVEEVGQGRRDVHLNIHTHDELEDLATTFEKMIQSLGELERVRRDLISMIVHDLKMPLATILPSLESLLAGDFGPLPKEQANFIQMARRSGMEMLMLIQNLLDVAKMEEGRLALHREPFVPADWAGRVVANFRPLAEAAKKKLTLTLGAEITAVDGDVALLDRVLGNLISNALRHTPVSSGEVAVSLYREGNQLAVEVRDNGEGIPPEEQAHVFDKFVQGEGQRTRLRSGAGLGLTFCKIVVQAHGGHITLFSQPRVGSVFTFHLPLQHSGVAATAGAEPRRISASTR